MATKGAKSKSVDMAYLNDAKLEKGKKELKAAAESTWKGPSSKDRRAEEAAEKQQRAARKAASRSSGKEEKVSWKKKVGVFAALFLFGGVGVMNFLQTVMGAFGAGATVLDVHDTAKLKEVLFGGEPWLVYCVNNQTKEQRLPKVLEDSTSSLWSNLGLNVGVLSCWDQMESGRSVAKRFKLREKPPLVFLVANANKPRIVNLVGVSKPEDLEKKVAPALKLDTQRIDTLKRWPSACTSRRTCLVVGHKHSSQRDQALNIIRPLMESHRTLKVVTLDTSFWSLKLDDAVLKRRVPQVKGDYKADILCLARIDGGKGNNTHQGDFLQSLDSSSASSFLTACEKQQDLVKIGVPPRIKAKSSKPKKVKAPPAPIPRRRTTPAPRPQPKDTRSGSGKSSSKVDGVGSRAAMEAAAAEDPLFEAVDEEEDASNSDGETSEADEDDNSEGEDDDGASAEDTDASEDEVEL